MAPASSPHVSPEVQSVVYLNFLSPGAVDRIEDVRNISLVTIGALAWDMLLYLKGEWLLMKHGLSFEVFSYFICRVSTFVYVLLQAISRTEEVGSCSKMALAIAICEMVSTSSSGILFFLRIWSMYADDASIRYTFLVFLLFVVGASSVVPIGKHAVPLPGTRYCLEMHLDSYVGATTLLYLLFELSVYLSIAYKTATLPALSGEAMSLKSMASPNRWRRLRKAFFDQGQQHYLISISFNIAVTVAIIVPSISSDYKNMLLIPDLALSSAMACRVFRHFTLSTDRLEDALSKAGKSLSAPLPNMKFSFVALALLIASAAAQETTTDTILPTSALSSFISSVTESSTGSSNSQSSASQSTSSNGSSSSSTRTSSTATSATHTSTTPGSTSTSNSNGAMDTNGGHGVVMGLVAGLLAALV
ncbi:hypothetical protein CVT24_008741 [Panaeolus cyanescens]|uniref:Uncharacterized protein n=1 Tax=Panaeolus cyanescens TaxID=181874 RepID=A0A409VEC5_9AGAR|nr:hypothetical protein CVT24_008741 [Panaeolus cyanescens]